VDDRTFGFGMCAPSMLRASVVAVTGNATGTTGPLRSRERAGDRLLRRVIDRYTADHFDEEALDDERWCGPVQRFESRR
jgi:hypothetical protein